MTVKICQRITHPDGATLATILVTLPAVPLAGDKLELPGTKATVAHRAMKAGSRDITVWLENENRAYKGVATTIDKLKAKRAAGGWTLTEE